MSANNGSEIREGVVAGKWAARNVNSIMLAVVLLGIGAIARIGWDNSITLAEMKGGLVTRPELEAKLAEIKTSQLSLEKDLTALKLALAERGITQKK